MVNRNLLRELDTSEVDRQLEELDPSLHAQPAPAGRPGAIVAGRVVHVTDRAAWIDVGVKGLGVVSLSEWGPYAPPRPREPVAVLLEPSAEDEAPRLSYRKARFDRQWREFVARHKEGDTVSATVTALVAGGLRVDIGVPAFLPGSQVDIRRPADLAGFVGRAIDCRALRIDTVRRDVVVSRRKLLEGSHPRTSRNLLAGIEPGQVRTGVVKNIAEFGAFVDLGGIDGLLHVTDMAWSRVNNPRDVVRIDETIEVHVLSVDRDRERVALSLKHKTPNPWLGLVERLPVGSRHAGEVVQVLSYGAVVKLEAGLEGLVHVSEMSWTRRFPRLAEFVPVGDEVEVQVLSFNPDKQELLLGMRQATPDPWGEVVGRYLPGAVVLGVVRSLTNYGAFVELAPGIDGLLHLDELRKERPIAHPREALSVGGRVACVVLSVDSPRRRIALGLRPGTDVSTLPAVVTPERLQLPAGVLDWGNGLVVRMARQIREARAFDEMPVLADALEDAGCAEEAALAHLRDGRPHARRCWVLDLILGTG